MQVRVLPRALVKNTATTNQQPSLPVLRAEVKRLKARLADLDDFEAEWNGYAKQLRGIVEQIVGEDAEEVHVRPLLEAAERTRVRIVSLGYSIFDASYFGRVEFSRLTGANLRTEAEHLFVNLSEREGVGPGSRAVITENALEARLGEASGLITRKREQIKADLRALELVVGEHEHDGVTLRAWAEKWLARVPLKPLRGFLWVALLDHTKKVLGGLLAVLILAGVHYCAPGVERAARDLWSRVTSDSTGTTPR